MPWEIFEREACRLELQSRITPDLLPGVSLGGFIFNQKTASFCPRAFWHLTRSTGWRVLANGGVMIILPLLSSASLGLGRGGVWVFPVWVFSGLIILAEIYSLLYQRRLR